ncbi:glycosyltransferase family 39 protein [Microtetraspora sp. AC03309]|uniref:glycosyltransferase family 39 protein n=1 Tax=Microtetraspora sp. AC03309 TaxID=2779376 RepID=UPI001E582DC6|nr:glycosyltransferase family 39 protein [Microtetraspora sp. AC03309]MCC5575808.1 glycosyltransferase family 39 protein [Microtetraspora sp. AC03309]
MSSGACPPRAPRPYARGVAAWGARVVRVPAAMAGLAAIGVFLWTAVRRVGYPYGLEWLEGNSLVEVGRLLAGRPLYSAPTIDYVPDGYPPLYFVVAAGPAGLLGMSYLPLRLVSLLATLSCFALLTRLVQRETGDLAAGVAAAGLYAATYFATGTWFDLARVDSLFLAFSLAGLYAARWMRRPRGAVAAGLLLAAAFLTKQNALAEAAAIIAVLLFGAARRLALITAGTFVLLVGLTTLLWGAASRGWYVFYVFRLLGEHPFEHAAWAGFWIWYLFPVMGVALGAALLAAGRVSPVLAVGCLALVVEGYAGLLHAGGAANNMLPVFAVVALLAGVAMGGAPTGWRGAMAGVLVLAQIVFLAATTFAPGRTVPTAADRRVGDGLLAWLRGFGGPVAVFSDPGLAVIAGLPAVAHRGAVYDIVRGTSRTAQASLARDVDRAVAERRFAAIVVEQPVDLEGFPSGLARAYRRCPGTLLAGVPRQLFRPVAGPRVRPSALWLPVDRGSCAAAFDRLARDIRS